MEPDFSRASGVSNFEFAFNSANFSDRILRIEIIADPAEIKAGPEGSTSLADWDRNRKRRREDLKLKDKGQDSGCHPLPEVTSDVVKVDDFDHYDDNNDDAVAMIEESPTNVHQYGDDAQSVDSYWSSESSQILDVKMLHINSAILAEKSPFFYKLFSNGMKESDQRHATLRISASEETAIMELLSFIYSGKLSATSPTLLLDVLMAADKYEVTSCMSYCSQLLGRFPMTKDSALLYLDLPGTISLATAVQPLTDAAKDYLAHTYKDVTKFHDEVMNLPLAGIEAVFSSSDLQVATEDAVYDLLLKWVRTKYQTLEERRDVLGRLIRYVRFAHMTSRKLRKVLQCPDLDPDLANKAVTDALLFKVDAPYRQRALATDETKFHQFLERAYKYRPLKVVEFDQPFPQCIAYLDLKREECARLYPCSRIYSQAFHLAGEGFFLSAHCNIDQQNSTIGSCFGLFLGMQEKGTASVMVDYEFAVRAKPSGEFESKYKGNYTFTGGKAVGYRNLFSVKWEQFIAEDSKFFINNVLHLRAELMIKQPGNT